MPYRTNSPIGPGDLYGTPPTAIRSDEPTGNQARGTPPNRGRRDPAVFRLRRTGTAMQVREAMVEHIVVAVGIGMALVFSLGFGLGIVIMIAMAIHREDRRGTLTGRAPGAGARGVRRLVRLGLRDITPPEPGRWTR